MIPTSRKEAVADLRKRSRAVPAETQTRTLPEHREIIWELGNEDGRVEPIQPRVFDPQIAGMTSLSRRSEMSGIAGRGALAMIPQYDTDLQ
jgi:hypothetical protein